MCILCKTFDGSFGTDPHVVCNSNGHGQKGLTTTLQLLQIAVSLTSLTYIIMLMALDCSTHLLELASIYILQRQIRNGSSKKLVTLRILHLWC